MKSKRQNEIIRLITTGDIETQEELASELRALGYKVTQATVSRDIRELRLIKVEAKGGGFKYAKPERHEIAVSERLTRILTDSLVNVDASGNLIVVKTLSGSANVAAEALGHAQNILAQMQTVDCALPRDTMLLWQPPARL